MNEINFYGPIILISIIVGLLFIYINAKEIKFKKEEFFYLILYIFIGIIVGAKYYEYFTNIEKYETFDFLSIGLSSYGAIIGIIIMLYIYSKQFKKDIISILYIVIPSLPLIYGLSKIACFISGCCYGIQYNGIFNIVYNNSHSAPSGVHLFPVQIIETIVFVLIFIFFHLNKNRKDKNKYIGYIFITCGIFKFLLDFLRYTHTYQTISSNQITSIMFIIIGFVFTIKKKNYTLKSQK